MNRPIFDRRVKDRRRRAKKRPRGKIKDGYYYAVNNSERTIINDPKRDMSAYWHKYKHWTEFSRVCGFLLNLGRAGRYKDYRVVAQ